MRSRVLTEQDLERFTRHGARVRGGVGPIDRARRGDAGENPAPSPSVEKSPYRSKWEAAYAAKLELEKQAGRIRSWCYEPMSFKLSKGKRYRPDFLIEHPLGSERRLEFIEVKGNWGRNRRDGMTHLKWAAQLFPMFTWTLTWREGHGWESCNVEV